MRIFEYLMLLKYNRRVTPFFFKVKTDTNGSRNSLLSPGIQVDPTAGMENEWLLFSEIQDALVKLSGIFFFMLRNQLYFYSFHSRIKLSKFMGVPIITCLWDTSYIFVVKCAEWKKNKEKQASDSLKTNLTVPYYKWLAQSTIFRR